MFYFYLITNCRIASPTPFSLSVKKMFSQTCFLPISDTILTCHLNSSRNIHVDFFLSSSHILPLMNKENEISDSILPNFDFFDCPIFAFKLGHFKVQTIFLMLQTLKLYNKKQKNLHFTKKKVW
jgi:hypothetical protein